MAQGTTESNIFSKYIEIKHKNEMLKVTTYTQSEKQTTTSQHRLLPAFDTEKGKMYIAFLEAQGQVPKTAAGYKDSIFSFERDEIHPIYLMDICK